MNFETLDQALAARKTSAHAVHYIEGETSERALTYGEVHTRALGLLHHFQAIGAGPGSEMILLVERNEQFVDAFWACVLGNIIAVPLAPGATDEHRLKLFRVLAKLKRPHLCTDQKIFARLAAFADTGGLTAQIERLRPVTVFLDRIDDISRPGRAHPAKPSDIAFVQYSSGSTSEPKGVSLTHGNLLANIDAIASGINLKASDSGLSWMPLTHDMGLIGFHLTPLVMDVDHYLMPTGLFVRRPSLWLTKASEKKATVLCSPNFGYKHLLKTSDPAKLTGLDLSRVRILFNGAEPISIELCREFLAALAPAGLQGSAMFPVYGLAEASLAATFPRPSAGCATVTVNREALAAGGAVERVAAADTRAITLVQVGHPVKGCEVKITTDSGMALPENTVGRIHIRGANVSRGYYNDPDATAATIDGAGWLDTGDLGFLSGGELTVTGRAKEILFAGGQNYYPHDLEEVIAKHAGIELGRAAACGARPPSADTDEVLVFVTHRGELREFLPLAKAVRKSVNEHIGVVVDHVMPLTRLPKTTSGKIQRYLLAEAYQKGEFKAVLAEIAALESAASAPAGEAHTDIEKKLKEICDAFITSRPLGIDDNIFELGTSSLTLAQIYQRIEAVYPGQLEVTDFFDYPTIAQLAKYLEQRLAAAHA